MDNMASRFILRKAITTIYCIIDMCTCMHAASRLKAVMCTFPDEAQDLCTNSILSYQMCTKKPACAPISCGLFCGSWFGVLSLLRLPSTSYRTAPPADSTTLLLIFSLCINDHIFQLLARMNRNSSILKHLR